ncbi:MAG: DinB family protein [Pseudomonadota bacterium]
MIDTRAARVLARYNQWADRLIHEAVAKLPPGESVKPRQGLFKNMAHMLNHIYVIDRIFQAHLEGRPHGYAARNTPDHPPLEELRRAQQEIDAWYVAWSDRLTPEAMQEEVAFEYVGGGEGVMTRGEILLHIVNHSTYHRGFVAEMIYRIPATPPATDFTVYIRDVPQQLD